MAKDTKQRILDAAERLFAERGYAGVSLRTIVAKAGVNLASVHYHYRSKEELLKAVFARRLEPLNRERLAALDDLELRLREEQTPPVECVLEAFLAPVFRLAEDEERGGPVFMRLVGLMYGESGDLVRMLFMQQMTEVAERFYRAFARALPELSREEIYWRLFFMVGVMAHTMRASDQLQLISGGLCKLGNAEVMTARVVHFLAAAMRAPEGCEVRG
ncbi:MAG: TetR family transcriptional regulator [Bryobacterales bacterium]|nr:TetR family transcriptional regulator [Bryobacterales bacterium]